MDETTLIEKGRSVPLAGLAEQARVHADLRSRHRERLRRAGWSDAHSRAFDESRAVVASERAARVEALDAARAAAATESAEVTRAKAFKHRLDLALDDIYADAELGDGSLAVQRASFNAGAQLARRAPLISRYLADIRPHVVRLEAQLAPYFDGRSAVALLDEAKAGLDAALAASEAERPEPTGDTRYLCLAKGRLLALIEKMNRIAAIAFDGDAAVRAQFNKDLVLRARRHVTAQPPVPARPGR